MASRGSHLLLLSHAAVLLLYASTATTGAQALRVTTRPRAAAGIAAVFAYNAVHGVQLNFIETLSSYLTHYSYMDYDFYYVTVLFNVHLDGSVTLPFPMTSIMTFAVPRDQYPLVQNIISGTFKFTRFAIYRH
ncbi:hypothetical protein AXF42_Ash006768 [Apostasia shenzhenica]|uniref:Uncharacterized protein n=1 Tax=Apostasia shenzhenica TaxID=1088818 RepID=A0A2I0AJB8_9ASPA|nr:hypothetical protein AXF42_Ash006768 [Apostasia shenzhenica]